LARRKISTLGAEGRRNVGRQWRENRPNSGRGGAVLPGVDQTVQPSRSHETADHESRPILAAELVEAPEATLNCSVLRSRPSGELCGRMLRGKGIGWNLR